MRNVSEAEKHWRQLDRFHSLTDLKISVSSHNEPLITAGLRSVCWKIFLLFKTLDRSTWLSRLVDARTNYHDLRSHYLRAIQHPDEFESSVDPLTENDESPWVALRADEALRAEIFQDIERCMPDNVYFRQPATQNMMLDILFIWCKIHSDVGYRQGMHEILAPILWVVERDAVEKASSGTTDAERALSEIMDSEHIEHDTFTLFRLVMQTGKSFYAPAEKGSASKDTPMLSRSARIFERYLPKADPALSAHLMKLEIVPQIFLLRWIRLLFGREFSLDSVLDMWDALFAIDATLELVDMISIAMLLRIRWQLIESDTNEAFSLLLRYPEPDVPAYAFIKDALYLRDHLSPEGGVEIITRYGKKAPVLLPAITAKIPEVRAPSPAPSFTSSRTRNSVVSPRTFISNQSGGLESLLQNAAKGVIDRGSQWGVGRAIRDAVGEVKKNVEAYQTGASTPALESGQTTPILRSGGREYRKPGRIGTSAGTTRPGLERTPSGNIIKKIEHLEKRNKDLSKMLESAIGELWDYHKERSENGKEVKESVEALSLAIAKVQFVQVYLEDASLPLPIEDLAPAEPDTGASTPRLAIASPPVPERTSSAPPTSASPTNDTVLLSPASRPTSPPSTLKPSPANSTLSPRSRPQLTSSNFSWMLGQGDSDTPPRSTFAKASEHSAFASDEKRRMRGSLGKGYLFGDDEGALGSGSGNEGSSKRGSVSGKGAKKGKDGAGKGKAKGADAEVEEEVIDLEDVGKRGAVS
ncbi:RabGAP/TBC [Lophiostoma macrostomum CBS 122681]|uniref:RabGAP/TBC n=1 Tax=Lophiostoma macrostomum CBS 122681 TaxID=1314788 RepID=A0A6A6TCB3_9PLEO|nr:RabGAP/TBC [Lophiostoma macrostomum CBS 122681]